MDTDRFNKTSAAMSQDSFEVGPEYFHLTIGLAVLALFSGALRFASRWLSKARFGVDDAWMLVSMTLMVALMVDAGYGTCIVLSKKKKRHTHVVPVFVASGNGRSFSLATQEQMRIFRKGGASISEAARL